MEILATTEILVTQSEKLDQYKEVHPSKNYYDFAIVLDGTTYPFNREDLKKLCPSVSHMMKVLLTNNSSFPEYDVEKEKFKASIYPKEDRYFDSYEDALYMLSEWHGHVINNK